MEQPANKPAESAVAITPKQRVGAVLSGVGGLLMLVNGIQYFRGAGSAVLTMVAAAIMIGGMGMRGQLTKKVL